MKDQFPAVAEWVRRHKLEAVRSAPSGAPLLIKPCLLCLRQGRHIYSVAPDPDYEEGVAGGSALTWSAGVLRCDEYFLISDTGDRIVLRRFARPSEMRGKRGFPLNPEYPTMGAYYYEQQGVKIIWKFIADQDVDDTTWKLWHQALAGFKIDNEAMDDVVATLKTEAVKHGWSRAEVEQRKTQGFACFVSECKGVRAVLVHAGHGLESVASIGFANGEPFRPQGSWT